MLTAYEKPRAYFAQRSVLKSLRLRCRIEYCASHLAYHVVYSDRYRLIDRVHLSVLEKIAMGLRDPEIAHDLGMSQKQVEHAVTRLMRRLNALSRGNLIAISIALGIINPSAFIAEIKE